MRNRSVFAFVCLLLCLGAVAPTVGADGDVHLPDEDAVVIDIDPSGTDTVTLFFQTGTTWDPDERALDRAENADIPIVDVRVNEVKATQTVRVNGNLVEGGPLYETTIETDLGRRTGLLEGQIASETVEGLAVDESKVIVGVPTGTTVRPASQRSHSFDQERYGVDGDLWEYGDNVTYGVGSADLALLGGLLAGSLLAPFLFFRKWARSIMECDDPLVERVHAVRETRSIAAVFAPVVPLVAALWLGAFAPIEFVTASVLPTIPSGAWWTVTLWFVAFGPFACAAWLGSTLGIAPVYQTLVDAPYNRRRVFVAWSRSAATSIAWYWLVAAVLYGFSSRIVEAPAMGALLVGLLLVAKAGATPVLTVLTRDVGPVTDELSADVEALCEQEGVDIRGLYRLGTGESPEAKAFVTGLPGFYWVFVSDDVVDQCDPAEVRAMIAHELGHLRAFHIFKRIAFSVGYWFVAFTAYSVVPSIWVLLIAIVLYRFYVLGWVATAQEYTADAYAASVTSSESVAEMLDRTAAINVMKRDTGRQEDLANGHPSIEKRIARLRGEAEDLGDGSPRET